MAREFLGNIKGSKGDKGEKGKDTSTLITNFRDLVENDDWSNALNEALKSHNHIVFPEGRFNLDSINLPSDTTISGLGTQTVINVDSSQDLFTVKGEYGDEKIVTTDIEMFSNEVILNDVTGLNIGDDILIKSCVNSFNNNFGDEWLLGDGGSVVPYGEYGVIKNIEGNTITLMNDLLYPYYPETTDSENKAKDNTTITKVNFKENVTIENMLINKNKNGGVLRFNVAKNCKMNNVICVNDGYTSGYTSLAIIQESLNCSVENSMYKIKQNANISSNLDHRNVFKIISSSFSGFKNCVSYNGTQSGDITFLNNCVPSTGCYFVDCKFFDSDIQAITTHQGNYMTKIIGNTVKGGKTGFSLRGKKNIVSNNTMIGDKKTGINFLSFAIGLYTRSTGESIITNNNITNYNTGVAYVDDGVSRARFLNTIISNNHISNTNKGVHIFRYSTGDVRTEFMAINIINNIINIMNETQLNFNTGVHLDKYTRGVKIKDNIIKGMNKMATGVHIDHNSDEIIMTDNTMHTLNRNMFLSTSATNTTIENNLVLNTNTIH